MSNYKLLPCPFCGGSGNPKNMRKLTFFVKCNKCSASTGMYIKKEEALAAWNRRVDIKKQ